MVRLAVVGGLGRGLLLALGIHVAVIGGALGLSRLAPRVVAFDSSRFVSYVELIAVLLDFAWMLLAANLGMSAIRRRQITFGIGLLLGAFAPIAGYLVVS